MDHNYEIHAADGERVTQSNVTGWSKATAVRKARAVLASGVGAYALITRFDWGRGNCVIGKANK